MVIYSRDLWGEEMNLKTLEVIMFEFRTIEFEFFVAHNIQPGIASEICANIQLKQK